MANTVNITVDKTSMGLDQVNNTSDVNKPISTATQTALNGKEDVANKSTSTSLGTSDTRYPTQNAVKVYTDNLLGNANALVYKGVVDCSTNPNYPSANAGELYIVSVAGKIGGASGINVEVGDMLICNTDSTASGNQATVGAYWNAIQKNIDGSVTGGASSVNNNLVHKELVFKSVTNCVIAVFCVLSVIPAAVINACASESPLLTLIIPLLASIIIMLLNHLLRKTQYLKLL